MARILLIQKHSQGTQGGSFRLGDFCWLAIIGPLQYPHVLVAGIGLNFGQDLYKFFHEFEVVLKLFNVFGSPTDANPRAQ